MTSILKYYTGTEQAQLPVNHGKGPPIRGPEQMPELGDERRKTIIKRVVIVLVIALLATFVWVVISTDQATRARQQNA